MEKLAKNRKKGFTLIELVVVVFIIAIISLVLYFLLNPAELLKQSRDGNRLSALNTIDKSVSSFYADGLNTNPSKLFIGTSSIVYISIPDPLATSSAGDQCQGLNLSSIPVGWNYHCAPSSTYLKTDGTGWIPINFSLFSGGSPISVLPVDPTNTTSSCEYYAYTTTGNNYEVVGRFESLKNQPVMANDSGQYPDLYEKGSPFTLLPRDLGDTVISINNSQNTAQSFNGCTGKLLSQFSGSGSNAISNPYGIAIAPNGNIYIENDYYTSKILIFDSNGNYISQFGSPGTGNGQFTNPDGGIAISPLNGNVYVTDSGGGRVEIFDSNGNYISQFGTVGTGFNQFDNPRGIAINASGTVYVTDYYNGRAEVWSASGTYMFQIASQGNGQDPGTLICPIGAALDANSNVFITSSCGVNRVDEFSATGTWLSRFGGPGSGNGQFGAPYGIAISLAGNIYVADKGYNRVEVFSPSGNYISQFSQTDPTYITVK